MADVPEVDPLEGLTPAEVTEPPTKAASAVSEDPLAGLTPADPLEGLAPVQTDPDEANAYVSGTIHGATKLPESAILPPTEAGFTPGAPAMRKPDTTFADKIRAGLQGATSGLAPHMLSRFDAAAEMYRRGGFKKLATSGPGDPEFDEALAQVAEKNLHEYKNAAQDNMGSSLIGAVISPNIGTGKLKGVQKLVGMAGIGALFNGIQSGLEAEKDESTLAEIGKGAAIGAVAAPLLGSLFTALGKGARWGVTPIKDGKFATHALEIPVSPKFTSEVFNEVTTRVANPPTSPLKFKTKAQLLNQFELDPDAVPRTVVGTPAAIKDPMMAGVKMVDGELRSVLVGTGDDLNAGIHLYSKPLKNSDDVAALEKLLSSQKNKGVLFEVGVREWEQLPESMQNELALMWKRVMTEGRERLDDEISNMDSTVSGRPVGRSTKTLVAKAPVEEVVDPTARIEVLEPTQTSATRANTKTGVIKPKQFDSGELLEGEPQYVQFWPPMGRGSDVVDVGAVTYPFGVVLARKNGKALVGPVDSSFAVETFQKPTWVLEDRNLGYLEPYDMEAYRRKFLDGRLNETVAENAAFRSTEDTMRYLDHMEGAADEFRLNRFRQRLRNRRGGRFTLGEETNVGPLDPDLPPVRPGADSDPVLEVTSGGQFRFKAGPPSTLARQGSAALTPPPPVIQGQAVPPAGGAGGGLPPQPPINTVSFPGGGQPALPPGAGAPPPPFLPYGPNPQDLKVFDRHPILRALQRAFSADHARLPMDLGDLLMDAKSIKNLRNASVDFANQLEKTLKTDGTDRIRFGRALQVVGEGNKPISWLEKNYPQLTQRVKPVVLDMLARRTNNHQWLVQHGRIPPETLTKYKGRVGDGYLTRDFLAFAIPGYVDKVKKNNSKLFDDTVQWIIDVRGLKGSKNPEAAAERILRDLVTEGEEGLEKLISVKAAAQSPGVNVSRARSDVPRQIRKFLGENRDGLWSLSQTIAKQEALIQQVKVEEGLLPYARDLSGDLQGHKLVPNDPAKYGKLAGKYLPEEAWDSFVYLPNLKYEGPKIAQALINWQKMMLIAGGPPRMFVNMFMDNFHNGIMAGGVDPLFKPQRTFEHMRKAWNSIWAYEKSALGNDPTADLVLRARARGVDASGHIGPKLDSHTQRKIQNIIHDGVMGGTSYTRFMDKVGNGLKQIPRGMSFAVDLIDRVHKLASWSMIMEDLSKKSDDELKQLWGPMLTRPTTRDEMIESLAARRIAKYYAMYDRLPAATEMMRSKYPGIVGTFSTYAMERNRTLATAANEAATGRDPGAVFRMMKYGAALAGIAGGDHLLKNFGALGVDQDDVEMAMLAREGSWQSRANSMPYVLPFKVNGKIAVMNLTPWAAPLAMFNGDQQLNPVARAALSAVMGPLSGGAAGEASKELLKQGGVQPVLGERDPKLGETGGAPFTDALVNNGVIAPRALTDGYRQLKSTGSAGTLGMFRDEMDPAIAALKYAGLPVEQTIDLDAFTGTRLGAIKKRLIDMREAKKAYIKAAKMGPDAAADATQKLLELMGENTRAENLVVAADKQLAEMQSWVERWDKAESNKRRKSQGSK